MRTNHHRLLAFALLFPALAASAAGEISIFVGPPGGLGDIRIFDEGTARVVAQPGELTSLRLVPVDFTGRSPLDGLLPERPRLRQDVPGGGSRILLPNGQGSLYKVERQAPGGLSFGYVLVGPDGVARLVLELPGTGPLHDQDPLPFRVAVDPAGSSLLAATSPAAGGDLLEIDLVTGAVEDRTAALGPRAFEDGGLALVGTWGVGCTPAGIYRFDRAPGAQASLVTFPDTVGWCLGGVVCSADGSMMATAAGADAEQADVFVLGATGPAERVSDQTGRITSAGFLPEFPDGPYLALSPDGSFLAWRTEPPRIVAAGERSFVGRQPLVPSREVFVKRTGPTLRAQEQLTGDARFADTLDDSGVIGFLSTTTLVMLVGAATPQGVGDADLYQVSLAPTGGVQAMSNLSLTSGDAQMPFLAKGDIEPGDELLRVPGSTDVFAHFANGGADELRLLRDGVSQGILLLDDAKDLDFVEFAGTGLLAGVRRKNKGSRDLVRVLLGPAPSATVVGSLGETHVFADATATLGSVGFVIQFPGGGELVGRTAIPSGVTELFGVLPQQYGSPLGHSPLGALLATWETAGTSRFGVWPDGGTPYALQAGTVSGHFLPGS